MSNERPTPRRTTISEPFWKACNEGILTLQRCRSQTCGRYIFYPRVCCPNCGGGELEWQQVSGRGRIRSFTKVHRPLHESFQGEVPIYFVAVTLDEGPILYSRLQERPASDDGLLDASVRAVFEKSGTDQALPVFVIL
ncbi:MAG: Zn-ribbon domain-containing OB-fold protein [Acidiferrobacterales bacterium]